MRANFFDPYATKVIQMNWQIYTLSDQASSTIVGTRVTVCCLTIFFTSVMMNNLLQMAATESSMDLALKLFTAKPLQYYHQQPARSRITCAAICKEDHRDKCTGFSFNNKECLLYNTHINMQTDEHSREALAIFVFGGMWNLDFLP